MRTTIIALGFVAALAGCNAGSGATSQSQTLEQFHADLAAYRQRSPNANASELVAWVDARPDLPEVLAAIEAKPQPPRTQGSIGVSEQALTSCDAASSDLADAFFNSDWSSFDSAMSYLNTFC